ncbi:NlpC/P60 family protein [candidate division KSB1 bacterium]
MKFEDFVDLFFQYGPFMIVLFIILFALPRLYKRRKNAPDDMKPIIDRNILIYQVLIPVLIIFCVIIWIINPPGPNYYCGEISNIDSNIYNIESPHLNLRAFTAGSSYKIDWIWKESEDKESEINFVNQEGNLEKRFYLHKDSLSGEKCLLYYDSDDGWLKLRGHPLPIKPSMVNIYFKTGFDFLFTDAYADVRVSEEGVDIERIIKNLQAVNFTIRDQAIKDVIKLAASDEKIVIEIIKTGFQMIIEKSKKLFNGDHLLTSLLTILNSVHSEWNSNYDIFKDTIGENALDLIVRTSGKQNPRLENLNTLALNFLLRFEENGFQPIKTKLGRESYRRNDDYVQGVIKFTSRLSEQNRKYLDTLAAQPWLDENKKFLENTKRELEFMDYNISENLDQKLQQIIDTAIRFKEKNIPFKWGGKNEINGFDSSGFIAYIFHRAGLLDKPETWWSGKIRNEFGEQREEKTPVEIGDLVFYEGGYVMLYLGDNKIIGMTEKGIVIIDYMDFRGEAIQVNKVKY